ncbi:MAG: hypothetical protein IPM50_09235 [Acidobacteriota bacterium]|nr:MAG: hypothetical protein IPM50_09235 [Acidobacteriota bacterium]
MAVQTEKDIRDMVDEWGRLQKLMAPIAEGSEALEKQIKSWLNKTKRTVTITGDIAIARRFQEKKFGSRKVDLHSFMEVTADLDPADRDECLKVEIKKAEQLLGEDTLNKIAERPTSKKFVTELELKEKPTNTVAADFPLEER